MNVAKCFLINVWKYNEVGENTVTDALTSVNKTAQRVML